jgi:hypothetical protein
MKKLSRTIFALVLAVCTAWAQATPITASHESGYRGDFVSVVLQGTGIVGLEALTVDVTFDPTVLLFIDPAALGTLTSTFDDPPFAYLDPSTNLLTISLTTTGSAVHGTGSLLSIPFEILANAPYGDTSVGFTCVGFSNAAGSLGCADFAFDPTTGVVTVLERQTQPIPTPATFWLLALGLPVLVATRTRR